MNLIIDIGNTRTKIFVFDKDLLFKELSDQPSASSLKKILSGYSIEDSIISSVVKGTLGWVSFLKKNTRCITLSYKTILPIKNLYKTKETLGNDRIANAAGAAKIFTSSNNLVIDIGTCIKYDFINDRNEYIGGAISPGLRMRYMSLHDYTSKLPLVKPARKVKVIGTDTQSSIVSGVQQGMLNEMEGYIRHYENEYKGLNVILTGGDADCFAHLFNFPIFAAPKLTAIGLNEILLYNNRKK